MRVQSVPAHLHLERGFDLGSKSVAGPLNMLAGAARPASLWRATMAVRPLVEAGVGVKLRRHHGRSWHWLRHDRRAKHLMRLLRGEGLLQVGRRVEAGWKHLWRVPEVGPCRGSAGMVLALIRSSGLGSAKVKGWWKSFKQTTM